MHGLALLALLPAAQASITGTFILSRHGDRLAKPATYLSPLGSDQLYALGSFYHDRYFDNSTTAVKGLNSTYHVDQVVTAAPDASVLQKSQEAFLQGLYPPLASSQASTVPGSAMSNGTTEDGALNNYQYVFRTGYSPTSADAMWLTGSTKCNTYTNASTAYYSSDEFKAINESTFDFYQSLAPVFAGVHDKSYLSYKNAYSIFDYWNVNFIHNETFYNMVENMTAEFFQVRTLSDQHEKALSWNATNYLTNPVNIGGRTLAGTFLQNLNMTMNGGQLLTYMATSYDVFYSLWGMLGLYDQDDAKWTGLINYAASLVFEISDENDQGESGTYVSFGFRNGTESSEPLEFFKILGFNTTYMPYNEFFTALEKVSTYKLENWCQSCENYDALDVCARYSPSYIAFSTSSSAPSKGSSLTLADAGGIGAGTTIGVIAILAALAFVFFKKRSSSKSAMLAEADTERHSTKESVGSGSTTH